MGRTKHPTQPWRPGLLDYYREQEGSAGVLEPTDSMFPAMRTSVTHDLCPNLSPEQQA
jgi:hypothetical protein